MTESVPPNLKHKKWSLRLIMFFVVITILGFLPWESIFSIQIRDSVLACLTNSSMGLFGLLGLLCTLAVFIRPNKRVTLLAKILSGCLAIPLCFLWILNLMLPTFYWNDTDVYRNGDDYLVVQEQETFVTTSLTYPRVVRTTSPYSMIRVVEEQLNLKSYDSHFEGNVITYKGKTWYKEPKKE
ncbi:hypothetical protein [Mucilaginibacter lappiensis]|uniref:hypothetical protein n=1 Tax=Mucilaginibacter lappiensis TaxID=354630 RepID=UPI003D22C8D4